MSYFKLHPDQVEVEDSLTRCAASTVITLTLCLDLYGAEYCSSQTQLQDMLSDCRIAVFCLNMVRVVECVWRCANVQTVSLVVQRL